MILAYLYTLTLQDLMGPRGSATYNEYISLEQDIRLKLKKYVIGFLKLERITWEKSSAALLEKVRELRNDKQVH